MSHSDYNLRLLDRLRDLVAGFLAGDLDVGQIQAALQSTAGLLENDGTGVVDVVRLAEADVEEIRFTRLLEEQRPAVTFRLDALLDRLTGDGS